MKALFTFSTFLGFILIAVASAGDYIPHDPGGRTGAVLRGSRGIVNHLQSEKQLLPAQQTKKTQAGNRLLVPQEYATIQAAINAGTHGDTVLVSDGRYVENIRYFGKAITVASNFLVDADTTHIENTIIDGSNPSHPDSGSVVYMIDGEDTTSVLCGLTITGGTGTPLRLGNSVYRSGGGIFCFGGKGAKLIHNRITRNRITDNESLGGGIIYGDTGFLILEENHIFKNHITAKTGLAWGGGVEILADNNVTVRITGNLIEQDTCIAHTYAVGGGIDYDSFGVVAEGGLIANNTFRENYIESTTTNVLGGGLRCLWTKIVELKNNLFMDNKAISKTGYAYGGALSIDDDEAPKPGRKRIIGNRFLHNQAISWSKDGKAGAMELFKSNAEISKNYLEQNSAQGKSYLTAGGAIFIGYSECIIDSNIISLNTANSGGGIYIEYSPQSGTGQKILRNTITHNTASISGGGIACYNYIEPEIENNLVAYNIAGMDGGGIDIYTKAKPNLTNNTIVENSADFGGAIAFNLDCDPVFLNTIIYGNSADSSGSQIQFWDDNSDPTFTYCDIEGGTTDFGFLDPAFTYSGSWENNIDADPLFHDLIQNGDTLIYVLQEGSPCIDAGHPDPLYNDLSDNSRNDMGAYGGQRPLTVGMDEKSVEHLIPEEYYLFQNYPNPFNPRTVISYQLSAVSQVELFISNILGQKVATLINKKQPTGTYKVEWNAGSVSSGIYFYTLRTDKGIVKTRKMVVLK